MQERTTTSPHGEMSAKAIFRDDTDREKFLLTSGSSRSSRSTAGAPALKKIRVNLEGC